MLSHLILKILAQKDSENSRSYARVQTHPTLRLLATGSTNKLLRWTGACITLALLKAALQQDQESVFSQTHQVSCMHCEVCENHFPDTSRMLPF